MFHQQMWCMQWPQTSLVQKSVPCLLPVTHKSYIVHALNSNFFPVVRPPYLQAGLVERRWLLTLDSLDYVDYHVNMVQKCCQNFSIIDTSSHPNAVFAATMNHLSNDIPFGINDWYFMNNVPQPIRTFLLLHAMISHNSTWIILSLCNIVPNLFLAP